MFSDKDKEYLRHITRDFIRDLTGINREFEQKSQECPERYSFISNAQTQIAQLSRVVDTMPQKQSKYFDQGEFCYTDQEKRLGTYGVSECLAILLVGDKCAAGAHVDNISDPYAFIRKAVSTISPSKVFLIGANTDIDLTYDVHHFLQRFGINEIFTLTQSGPHGFIYNAESDEIFFNPDRSHFNADWDYYDQKHSSPLMQASLLEKNPLKQAPLPK